MTERFRRSPHLISYWRGSSLIIENYARRSRTVVTPLACEILHAFDRWRSPEILASLFPTVSAEMLAGAVIDLLRHNLLEESTDASTKAIDAALQTWRDWGPSATYFQFSTKDGHRPTEAAASARELLHRAKVRPRPAPTKQYRDVPAVALPRRKIEGELPRTLLARRTWRRLSPSSSVSLERLAALLGLTFGVQYWMDVPGIGRVAMKTSPSGGGCHPIEPYVMALRVRGLDRGIYHYDAEGHRLSLINGRASRKQLLSYINEQWWFGDAAFVVLMTAVFGRTQWKYPAPRAYRVVLIDAGHLAQTFCLVATWLTLAPFCTMALAESRIERDLGIDGVTEAAIYAVGAGVRAAGVTWPTWEEAPYGTLVPNLARTRRKPNGRS